MTRTGQQIITDIIWLLRGTPLTDAIGGGVYRGGTRPLDSRAEDLVVIFTTADAGQFQRGVVTLNVYVQDILAGKDGIAVTDSARCEELEVIAQETVDMLTARRSNYIFKLRDAIHTQRDEEIGQSFIVVRLGFKYID